MKNLNLTTLILLTLELCLFKVNAQDVVLFNMNDSYQGADPDISLNTNWDSYGYDDNYNAAIKPWIFGINVSL